LTDYNLLARLTSYRKANSRHCWTFIKMPYPRYLDKLPSKLNCSGMTVRTITLDSRIDGCLQTFPDIAQIPVRKIRGARSNVFRQSVSGAKSIVNRALEEQKVLTLDFMIASGGERAGRCKLTGCFACSWQQILQHSSRTLWRSSRRSSRRMYRPLGFYSLSLLQ